MWKRLTLLAAALLALLAIASSAPTLGAPPGGGGGGGTTALPPCTASQLDGPQLGPQLGAVTINQGLGSYADQKLVRGKETLVRFFLKLPAAVGTTCSGSISVVNPTKMTLINASGQDLSPTIAAYQSYPSTGLQITSSSVSVNSNADPIFVVPASRVNPCYIDEAATTPPTPCATGTPFALRFKAEISYFTSASSAVTSKVFSTLPGSTTPIGGNFDQRTNALRILVIPMGDASQAYSTQFSTGLNSAQQAVQSGMDALSRMLPVPAGVSSTLRTDTGGIRYWLNLTAMLDLKAIPGAYPPGSTRFCGTEQNFNAIKAKLAWYLETYNSNPENAGFPADRVVGVVDKAISDGSTSSLNCAEGYASTVSPEAWVRAIPDQPAAGRTPAVPSMTGSLMAMELLHTLGQENVLLNLIHSPNTVADGTAPDRGYHVTSRSFIANDRTALNFVNTSTAPWNNNTTLLELGAFERALCNLGGSLASFCTVPSEVGTAPAPAGTGHFVISATTDGTPENTHVTSFHLLRPEEVDENHPVLETECLPSGPTRPYNLAFYTFRDAPGDPSKVCHVEETLTSEHLAETHVHSTTTTIAGAFLSPGGITRVEIREGTEVLHTEKIVEDALEIVGSTLGPGSSFTQTKTITTTPIPPIVDICLHQDESGSFAGQIATMKSLMTGEDGLIAALEATGSNYATCVTGFRDFAQNGWGDVGDWVYALYADVTPGGDGFTSGVPQLTAGGGGDLPEGYLQSLDYLATPGHAAIDSDGNGDTTDDNDTPIGEDPSWRDRAKRVALLATDDACHVKGDAVDVDLGGWPGDDHTASASTTADILAANDITVIGLTPQGPGEGEIACVKTLAETTGGSVHQTSTDAETLKNAIMAGLGNLPVTVQPSLSADCDGAGDDDLSVLFDGEPASEADKEVVSGDQVSWDEEFVIAEGATPGTLTCTITFLVDGEPVTGESAADFVQTVSVTVEADPTPEFTALTEPDPLVSDPTADIFISCQGGELPAQVAVPGEDVGTNLFSFAVNADTTNACAGPGGTDPEVTVAFSYGGNQEFVSVEGAGTTTEEGTKPENPTASIYAPATNFVDPETQPFALNGQVSDPDDGPLTPCWTITGPPLSGILITGVTGNSADVSPPSGVWPEGDYTVAIAIAGEGGGCNGTDSDGNTATTSVTVHVRQYQFSGFLDPIKPLPTVNAGKIKQTIPVKWRLRDQDGNFITDLGVVAAIRVAALPCPGNPPTACDTTPTGGTMLRYDEKANAFVYNWQTPGIVGTYVLTVHFTDGSTYAAYFKLTK